MTRTSAPPARSPLTEAMDTAHVRGVQAAMAGLSDAGLGEHRLDHDRIDLLADAAVTSATPYLRAPLLARLSAVLRLHSVDAEPGEPCDECRAPSPCPTVQAVR